MVKTATRIIATEKKITGTDKNFLDIYRLVRYSYHIGNKSRNEGEQMNRREIKAQRIRLGLTQEKVAAELGMNPHTYRKKESGSSPFSEDEKLSLAETLHLDPMQLNDFLFDGKLPI